MLRFRRVAALFACLMLSCAGGFAQQTVVEILATANVTGKLAGMQLWIDGYKQTTESTSTTLHFASFGIGKGTPRIAVLAVNTAGQVWEQAATVNSQ